MTMKHTLGAEAVERDGMTLDELAAFIEEARTSGVPGGAKPMAVVKFGTSKIKRIEVKG